MLDTVRILLTILARRRQAEVMIAARKEIRDETGRGSVKRNENMIGTRTETEIRTGIWDETETETGREGMGTGRKIETEIGTETGEGMEIRIGIEIETEIGEIGTGTGTQTEIRTETKIETETATGIGIGRGRAKELLVLILLAKRGIGRETTADTIETGTGTGNEIGTGTGNEKEIESGIETPTGIQMVGLEKDRGVGERAMVVADTPVLKATIISQGMLLTAGMLHHHRFSNNNYLHHTNSLTGSERAAMGTQHNMLLLLHIVPRTPVPGTHRRPTQTVLIMATQRP